MKIRPAKLDDAEALLAIALLTGASGQDATRYFRDTRLIGLVYALPYLHYGLATCVVTEDDKGVIGYAVGTPQSRAFEAELQRQWWPRLQRDHAEDGPSESPVERRYLQMIHHPPSLPEPVVAAFPAHLHLNVHPRAQGHGIGRTLVESWKTTARTEGVRAAHVGVSPTNARGLAFWQASGFQPLNARLGLQDGAAWLGCSL